MNSFSVSNGFMDFFVIASYIEKKIHMAYSVSNHFTKDMTM
jgi:hypothetical protein